MVKTEMLNKYFAIADHPYQFMKNPKKLLLALQISTGIMAAVLVVIMLGVFDVVSVPSIIQFRGASEEKTPEKVVRPKTSSNSEYQKLLDQGDNLFFVGKLDEAHEAYRKAAETEPREAVPYEKMGDIFFTKKNYNSARENFELASSIIPTNENLKIKIVRSLIGMRKIVDAKAYLEKINPPTQASLYYKGLFAAFLNDQALAKESLQKSITAGTDKIIIDNANKIFLVYRDFDIAQGGRIEYLQTMLAEAFDQAGEYGLSIELCFDALKTSHDYRDTWIVLGHSYAKEEKWLDAEDALRKAIDLDSMHPAAYFFLGIAKRNLQKNTDAISNFQQALKYGWQPKIVATNEIANIYFDLKDFVKAYPLYKEIVMIDASEIGRFVRPIALAINHLGIPQDAEILAKRAAQTHPNTAMAYNLLGWAALANNKFDEARINLEKALELDNELEEAYLNLGQLSEREGKLDEAIENYKKASELAEKSNNNSIKNTADQKIDDLTKFLESGGRATVPSTPQTQQIHSLSLQ